MVVLSCDQILARSIVRSMEILRSRSFHVSLKLPFAHVVNFMITWTRVHAITAALILSDARQAATSPAINKIVWEHSPTQIKRRERMRLNRGVASPINNPHVSSISSTRGAPHGRPRGHVASLPLGAPRAPPAWATRVLPCGLSATP